MKPVVVAPEASANVLSIDDWWRENRTAAPDLFLQELADAFATIAAQPLLGAR